MLLALLRRGILNPCLVWLVLQLFYPEVSSIASSLTDLIRRIDRVLSKIDTSARGQYTTIQDAPRPTTKRQI